MNWRLSSRISLNSGRIRLTDARRQQRTAGEILRRFDSQPGVILADEVGMGKTYVALAVATSVIEQTQGKRPVIVMVPASVQTKWPREWNVFRETCLGQDGMQIRATPAAVRSGTDFLKLLDDPTRRRQHLIFMTHGALTNSLSDPFVRLAIVRRALKRKALASQQRVFPRWAGQLLAHRPFWDEELVRTLLVANPRGWAAAYGSVTGTPLTDDPVPAALIDAIRSIDLGPLVDALQTLPLKWSSNLDARLGNVRRELRHALKDAWTQCLGALDIELPLLILDEAHHLKNPWTRFAGLFANEAAQEDGMLVQGPLGGVFDRMLFLTATPFQLGHRELIEVLRRFTGVRWPRQSERLEYEQTLEQLEAALDAAQSAALRLDDAWGRLTARDAAVIASLSNGQRADTTAATEQAQETQQRIEHVRARMRVAERLLKPWIIRHARPDKDARRTTLCGRAISTNAPDIRGLEVEGEAVLPFLLAARMQAVLAIDGHARNQQTRAYFAEGLASSFEAYRETRRQQENGLLLDDVEPELAELSEPAQWYSKHLDRALPVGYHDSGRAHPKVAATVDRVLQLWRAGEKSVVFCFYIATGKSLRHHISAALREEIIRMAAPKLGLDPTDGDGILSELNRRADRFFDLDSPARRAARQQIEGILEDEIPASAERERSIDVALRFLRTPSFLARYVDIGTRDSSAFEAAFATPDASGRTLQDKIRTFGAFVADRVDSEREELLTALETVQTGSIRATASLLDAGERDYGRDITLPNVRLANGEVQQDTRRRLMLAFNTPFFPEVLIASSVMAEGVDLHLECRHVIHHDLDWNPSVLEQRTGRLDRLGSKSEVTQLPILIYEPFLAGTQDEKQFKVVKDRERWFSVVMGERLALDEWQTDRLAERVPLPAEIADSLTMNLSLSPSRRAKRPH